MKKILGVGAALVDMLIRVDDAWVKAVNAPKGGMTPVDFSTLKNLLSGILAPTFVPGGSACNTLVGVSRLGARAAFLSKVGKDSLGNVFENHLKDSGVESLLKVSKTATGSVLSAVTPDAQRTMLTYLGASSELCADDVTPELFDDVGILYMEGYRAYDAECFRNAIRMARAKGAFTALDFGSFGVVNDCRPLFDALFQEKSVDLVIANEDEARAYTGLSEERALDALAELCPIAVVKLGKRGALISKGGEVTRVAPGTAKAVDTTGAGDLWASGFLYGLISGWNMEKCGKLAGIVADEVVQVMGTEISEEGWKRIHCKMEAL